MFGVLADHAQNSATADNFALVANTFNGSSDFHTNLFAQALEIIRLFSLFGAYKGMQAVRLAFANMQDKYFLTERAISS